MKQHIRLLISIGLFSLIVACTSHYHLTGTNYYAYQIYKGLHTSERAEKLIAPYRDSLMHKMNVIIGVSDVTLEKEQPEGTLGNFCADAFLEIASAKAVRKVDVCFMNNGGLRVPSLPKGNITVGNIYELMPFDNELVVMDISGKDMLEICNRIAQRGGWPVSGLRMRIVNYKAEQIFIQGKPLDEEATYTIATNDYLANGGDELEILKKYPKQTFNLYLRDALIEYISARHRMNQSITATKDQRITHEP
jgi:2',3'-cyclic-nucleotide 2'-phosphodiesterase (5'-nucleotidase family)